MSNKIGYDTNAESIVGISFQNIFPEPYGKVSTGYSNVDVTYQVEFPGIPTFEKWDIHDGRSGRKYWAEDETHKIEAQLENWIRTQLTGSAQILTCNPLHDLHTMSHDL